MSGRFNSIGKKIVSAVASAALIVSLAPAAALADVGEATENAGAVRVASTAAGVGDGGGREGAKGTPATSSLSQQITSQSKGLTKAKLSKKKIRARYKKVLRKAIRGKGVFSRQYLREVKSPSDKKYWKSSVLYAIRDVDKNGTPELLVHVGSVTAFESWHMFTVSSKKVKHLGEFASGMLMRGKGDGLYVWNQRMGYRWMYFATILYGKVRQQTVVFDSGEASGYPLYQAFVKKYKLKDLKTSSATKYALLNSKVK